MMSKQLNEIQMQKSCRLQEQKNTHRESATATIRYSLELQLDHCCYRVDQGEAHRDGR